MKMNILAKQIEELNQIQVLQVPQEVLEVFGKSIEDLKTKNIEEKSIKVGEEMPEFCLQNTHGQMISSKEILKKGKMILAFYRGIWCPYCNLELRFLQEKLSRIKDKNAVLVAISPQILNHSKAMAEKNNLEFDLVTDIDNTFAKKLGIVFQLQDFVLPYYQNLGINLTDFNNNEENRLPIPAAFVVDEEGFVIFRFLDVDYMNRLDIEELIKVL